jgi:hypothetical protein
VRDHTPQPIEEFWGLWDRGDDTNCPADHFRDCDNIDTFGFAQSVKSRDGIAPSQNVASPLGKILRIHNYVMQTDYTLLVLRLSDTDEGEIFHVINDTTVLGPILTIADMRDFKVESYAGRAYITPFKSYTSAQATTTVEKGLENEFLYVYLGDGTPARKAAGASPGTGTFTIANDGGQLSDAGDHLFGVCYEFDTGFITAPGKLTLFNSNGTGFDFSTIPVSGSADVVARRIVMSKVIPDYNGDTEGFQYFFIPDGRIPNNTATSLSNITVFDADLVEDASHLFDNFEEIPAGAALGIYHDRLCVGATFEDISVIWVSAPGEPEAISQITGLIIVPLDGNPITTMRELRDVLYVMKRSRTVGYSDNGGDPVDWPFTIVDQATGCPVHGIATVIDSGGTNSDYFLVTSYNGIVAFNGQYAKPELSWKIQGFWFNQNREEFRNIQVVNSTVKKLIYVALPDRTLLVGDYAQGLDPMKIKWWPFSFFIGVNTIALTNIDTFIMGSETRL